MRDGYSICTARTHISTNRVAWDVLLSFGTREFIVNLIVLPGLGIDVVLGMEWMKGHRVTIDTANQEI